MVTKSSFNIPKFNRLISRCRNQKLRSSQGWIHSRSRSPRGSLCTRGIIFALFQIQRPNAGWNKPHGRYCMIVPPQCSHALVLLNIPYFDTQIGRRRCQVSPLGTKVNTGHNVGVPFESAQILPRFMIPKFDRPVLAPARGHGVDGMQGHRCNHRRMTLKRVCGGRTGKHSSFSSGHSSARISTAAAAIPTGAMRVYLGIGRHLPFQFQHAALETGHRRPFLF
mmetsp:Transcript_24757/g.44469  ORF Transcript_24757/g.44469 Transcript_24757/m.44469 type:complete len:223 (+) Transcript_24757:706-1374(+)